MAVLKSTVAFNKLPITDAGDPPAPVTIGANKVSETNKVGETGDPNLDSCSTARPMPAIKSQLDPRANKSDGRLRIVIAGGTLGGAALGRPARCRREQNPIRRWTLLSATATRQTEAVPDEKRPSFFKRWSNLHRERKEAQKRFMGEYPERPANLSDLSKTADYKDVEAFFDANPARRGDDVTVGKIDDAGLRLGFRIVWLSKTSEVIARAANWLDADGPPDVPEYVFIVGSASTEQEARSAVVRSYTLDTLRDALYHFKSNG